MMITCEGLDEKLKTIYDAKRSAQLDAFTQYEWFRKGIQLYEECPHVFGELLADYYNGEGNLLAACECMQRMLHDLIDDGCCHFIHARFEGMSTWIERPHSGDCFAIVSTEMYSDVKSRKHLAKNVCGHIPNMADVAYELVSSTYIDDTKFVELVDHLLGSDIAYTSYEDFRNQMPPDRNEKDIMHEYNFKYLSEKERATTTAYMDFLDDHPDDGRGYR